MNKFNYWVMKCEPSAYSIADLERDRTTLWDGVRNYQARNFLKSMAVGDLAFFYHSNVTPPGIVGLMQIVAAQLVDPSQFDPDSQYYDPKATTTAPRWHTVKVEFRQAFSRQIDLALLRAHFTTAELILLRQGNRLSVMPVEDRVAEQILQLATSSTIDFKHPLPRDGIQKLTKSKRNGKMDIVDCT